MNKKILITILTFLICILSCSQEHGNGTMHLYIHTEEYAKTLKIDDSVSDVTKFSVTGFGPGGKSFTVDSTSSSIVIEGLPLGEWELQASGYNTKGKLISSGSIKYNLTSNKEPQTIYLNVISGSGALQLKYEWEDVIDNTTIEIELFNNDFTKSYLRKTLIVSSQVNYTTVNFNSLPSGYYLMKSKLKNNDVTFGSTVDAVKITSGEKTTGTLNFTNELTSDYSELHVPYLKGSPLTGHISGLSKINSTKNLELELVLDKQYDPSYKYTLEWYLDGELLEAGDLKTSGNTIILNTTSGIHILNAVVLERNKGICGSLTEKIKTTVTGKPGVPIVDGKIKNTANLNLIVNNTSLFGLLPNNKIVVVTPDRGIMQLFSISNSRAIIEQTLTTANKGTEWLYDTTALFTDKSMNLFLINDYKINMDYMFYNPASGKIENALLGDNILRFTGSTDIPTQVEFNGTRYATFIPTEDGGGVLATIDNESSKGYQIMSSSSGPYLCCIIDVNASCGPKMMKGYDDKIIVIGANSSLYSASFNGTQRTSRWYETPLGIPNPTDFIFLDRTNVLVTNGTRIVHCRYNISTNSWNTISSFEANVKKLISGNTADFFYVLDDENNIHTYSNNYYAFNKIAKTEISENIKDALITEDNHVICPCEDGSILILTIIE